jgi:hypothetical protein
MKEALAISWNITNKKIFTFYFNSSRVYGDTETETSDCTPKEIYVESIKMSSPSQNIIPYPSNFQGTPATPIGYEQFQPPSSNVNANNSKKIKIENDHDP